MLQRSPADALADYWNYLGPAVVVIGLYAIGRIAVAVIDAREARRPLPLPEADEAAWRKFFKAD